MHSIVLLWFVQVFISPGCGRTAVIVTRMRGNDCFQANRLFDIWFWVLKVCRKFLVELLWDLGVLSARMRSRSDVIEHQILWCVIRSMEAYLQQKCIMIYYWGCFSVAEAQDSLSLSFFSSSSNLKLLESRSSITTLSSMLQESSYYLLLYYKMMFRVFFADEEIN